MQKIKRKKLQKNNKLENWATLPLLGLGLCCFLACCWSGTCTRSSRAQRSKGAKFFKMARNMPSKCQEAGGSTRSRPRAPTEFEKLVPGRYLASRWVSADQALPGCESCTCQGQGRVHVRMVVHWSQALTVVRSHLCKNRRILTCQNALRRGERQAGRCVRYLAWMPGSSGSFPKGPLQKFPTEDEAWSFIRRIQEEDSQAAAHPGRVSRSARTQKRLRGGRWWRGRLFSFEESLCRPTSSAQNRGLCRRSV